MDKYCLEIGLDTSDSTLIHKVDCSHYDLGSLLGMGRIITLGEFADSTQALSCARTKHADAVRCLGCCHADLVVLPSDWRDRRMVHNWLPDTGQQ